MSSALVRELHEEIGLVVEAASLPPPVWTRDYIFRWKDVDERHLERFFLVRIDEHVVDISGLDADEGGASSVSTGGGRPTRLTGDRRGTSRHPGCAQLLLPAPRDGKLPQAPIEIHE